jgi:hypothetical protein
VFANDHRISNSTNEFAKVAAMAQTRCPVCGGAATPGGCQGPRKPKPPKTKVYVDHGQTNRSGRTSTGPARLAEVTKTFTASLGQQCRPRPIGGTKPRPKPILPPWFPRPRIETSADAQSIALITFSQTKPPLRRKKPAKKFAGVSSPRCRCLWFKGPDGKSREQTAVVTPFLTQQCRPTRPIGCPKPWPRPKPPWGPRPRFEQRSTDGRAVSLNSETPSQGKGRPRTDPGKTYGGCFTPRMNKHSLQMLDRADVMYAVNNYGGQIPPKTRTEKKPRD